MRKSRGWSRISRRMSRSRRKSIVLVLFYTEGIVLKLCCVGITSVQLNYIIDIDVDDKDDDNIVMFTSVQLSYFDDNVDDKDDADDDGCLYFIPN